MGRADKRVEFLRAWDDHTWDTDIVDVPADVDDLTGWAQDYYGVTLDNPGLVFVAIYSFSPEE